MHHSFDLLRLDGTDVDTKRSTAAMDDDADIATSPRRDGW